jgi:Tyrosine phosphatase family
MFRDDVTDTGRLEHRGTIPRASPPALTDLRPVQRNEPGANEARVQAASAIIDPGLLESVLGVAPAYVEEEYGSIEAYASEDLGLDDDALDALQEKLLTAE